MLNFYKTIDNRVRPISVVEDGCWVCAICPTEQEVRYLVDILGLEQDFVRAALDEEESSRVESEEEQTLVIVDVPTAEKQDEEKTIVYSTMPMAIITNNRFITTVCLRENAVITEISQGLVKNIQTHLRTQFLLSILLRIATRFLQYLKQIDKISYTTENLLHKTMRNKELVQILGLEKSLVYFSTSLKSNEVTLEKILRGRIIKLYDEDEELLEDVIIEVKQAIEMCSIYANVLSNTMDAFASIISNNLNIVMKVLTALTIVMALPNMVFGLYGMNVDGLPYPHFSFTLALAGALVLLCTLILWKKDMFK